MTIIINEEFYVPCPKCGVYRKPDAFLVKKVKRKSCSNCRSRR
jgi:phage terminase large subunit GpA-like protein